MTSRDQRIAIALRVRNVAEHWRHTLTTDSTTLSPEAYNQQVEIFLLNMPDYPNDLNAMRDATSTLTLMQKTIMFGFLAKMGGNLMETAFLSSQQHAEAFLKAINQWKDTP